MNSALKWKRVKERGKFAGFSKKSVQVFLVKIALIDFIMFNILTDRQN